MPRETIHTDQAPAAVGPYAQAVRAGNWVYLSGQIPMDPGTGALVSGDIAAQTRRVLDNLQAVLDASGLRLSHVVKVTVYLADMNDFQAMNEVYGTAFGQTKPARACIQAARLPKDVAIEMDAVAYAGP